MSLREGLAKVRQAREELVEDVRFAREKLFLESRRQIRPLQNVVQRCMSRVRERLSHKV